MHYSPPLPEVWYSTLLRLAPDLPVPDGYIIYFRNLEGDAITDGPVLG